MYINFKLMSKHKITAYEVVILIAIKQNEEEYVKQADSTTLEDLKLGGWIEPLKRTPKKYKLTKKSKNFLRDLGVAEVTEDSINLAAELINLYEDHNLNITNKKKIVEMVSWFLSETGFAPDTVLATVYDYINSTEKMYVSSLNNLICKLPNVFSTKWTVSNSKLYGLMT